MSENSFLARDVDIEELAELTKVGTFRGRIFSVCKLFAVWYLVFSTTLFFEAVMLACNHAMTCTGCPFCLLLWTFNDALRISLFPCNPFMLSKSFNVLSASLLLPGCMQNFSGAEIEGLVKDAVAYALNRQIDINDLSKPLDEQAIKVGGLGGSVA
jgi:hypothetical protein